MFVACIEQAFIIRIKLISIFIIIIVIVIIIITEVTIKFVYIIHFLHHTHFVVAYSHLQNITVLLKLFQIPFLLFIKDTKTLSFRATKLN